MLTNVDRWNRAKFTRSTPIEKQAARIRSTRDRYDDVSAKTGVPWDVIAVIHYRESSGDFAGVLHNGQKIIGTGRKTTLVPKGRGPFSTWEQSAIDALMDCAPYAGKNTDWSIGNTLDVLERYNGLGYRNKGLPSPYLWAGTDQYTKGKYVADGRYDPNHVDQQLGVAAILMAIRGNADNSVVEESSILKIGSKGPYVRELQANMAALGYDIAVDGDFGTGTEKAVRAFQQANGLNVDGWAGPRTIDAVGRAAGEKKAKGKAEREVEKKTGIWQWITGLFGGGGIGLGAVFGMDWQAIVGFGVVLIVFLIVVLVMRRQIKAAIRDIKSAVEGA